MIDKNILNLSIDTDLENVEFNVIDTNTTLNCDSNVPIDFPKRTPKRRSKDIYDEPRLYMSNDLYINSLIASNSCSLNEEEKQNSLRVLGKPKCWTDSIINSDGEVELSERGDSDGWTMQTPIRNIANDYNEIKDDKSTMIDIFKNLCIAARRVMLRGGVLLFQPISNLIQRMTRRRFTLVELRKLMYLSKLISVRWIKITNEHKELYPIYSSNSGDLIYDLHISLKIDGIKCVSSSDFNKALDIFTDEINRYEINCSDYVEYPLAELPSKPKRKLLDVFTPKKCTRESNSLQSDLLQSDLREKSDSVEKITPEKAYSKSESIDHSPSRLSSIRLSSLRDRFNDKLRCNESTTPDSMFTPRNSCRVDLQDSEINLESQESVRMDLLETPGMKRIKLAAMEREKANKGIDIVFKLDTKWLLELIYEMLINEEMSRVISLSSLYGFILNRCQSNVKRSRLLKILQELERGYPDVFKLSESAIDGSETLIISQRCVEDPKILNEIIKSSYN